MIIRERAIDASALGGAAFLVLAAWWLAGQMHDHPAGAPIARPAPTVTATTPAPASAPPSSRPAPSRAGPAVTVVAAGQDSPAPRMSPGRAAGRTGGSASARPSPTSAPPTGGSSSSGVGVRAAVRLPLGVLPDVRVDLNLGGNSR